MANTLKFGNGQWATKVGSTLAYNDENGNFKPLPFNFTRSTGATRVNKDGLIEMVTNNKPRIDFLNDSNGALLLEPNRMNLIIYSEFMTASNWQGGQTTANVILSSNLSPEGKANCYQVTRSSSGTSQVGIFTGITNGSTYTGSIYVRSISGSLSVSFRDVNGAGTTKSITTDWTRIDVTATASSTTGRLYLELVADGDVVEVYGAQLEEGSYATSYIPTQGAIATRVGEVCTGAGNDQVINSTEGVLYLEISGFENDLSDRYISISDGTLNNAIKIFYYQDGGTTFFRKNVNGAQTTIVTTSAINKSELTKIAVKYNSTNFDIFSNGFKISANLNSNSFPIGTLNEINFSNADGLSQPFYGKTKDLRVYNTALTDAELIALTTI
jgi:hypothetical protein